MDVLTAEQRRKNMQRIRSRDTKPEITLRKALWKAGYRYRKNYKKLPGKPDIAITKYRIAVFVDSEFFHGKDWDLELRERTERGIHSEYWVNKISRNISRDQEVTAELNGLGWQVIRFWSKDVLKNCDECVRAISEMVFRRKILGF